MTTSTASTNSTVQRNRLTGGILLIAIGLLLFAGQVIHFDHLFLPTLGVIFIVGSISSRNPGLMVPGGILLGIGFGVFLSDTMFFAVAESARSGLFLLGFAGGFASITVLSTIFTSRTQFWALIPATFLALIGGALLFGGTAVNMLVFLGRVWPVFLILGGLAILAQRK
jgi:hypothetical protein